MRAAETLGPAWLSKPADVRLLIEAVRLLRIAIGHRRPLPNTPVRLASDGPDHLNG